MADAEYRWTDSWGNKMTVPIRTDNDHRPGSLRWKVDNILINNVLQDCDGGITHTPRCVEALIEVIGRNLKNKLRR